MKTRPYILAAALCLLQPLPAVAQGEGGAQTEAETEAAERQDVAGQATTDTAERFELDPAHTYANFMVSHLGLSVLHGRFNETEGSLIYDPKGGKSWVAAVIRTNSIDTGHEERDTVLRGEKWFNATEHPTISYESESVTFIGPERAQVEGRLTLLGVTRQVPLEVDHIECGVNPLNEVYTCGFNAQATLRRSEFGMAEGLPMIGDTVSIRIQAEAQLEEKEPEESDASQADEAMEGKAESGDDQSADAEAQTAAGSE